MKVLRQLIASALLMLALTLPTLAGDMHSPVMAPPPPPPSSDATAQPEDSGTGEIDPLTEATLLMLQGVLALF